jgi:hypothetical protein
LQDLLEDDPMEKAFISAVVFGLLGGLVRGLVGVAKYFEKNKANQKLNLRYFTISIGIAALVGGVAGAIAGGDWRFAFIAGYAGTDFIEGLYKIRMKQGLEI